MHPGRGQAAQKAAQSHTGALAGNYEVMRTQVAHAGIALVETLDELADTSEILARYPGAADQGRRHSDLLRRVLRDRARLLRVDRLRRAELSKEGAEALKKRLPAFITPHNPLDLTTQPIWEPDLVGLGAKTLLDDPGIGSVVISITVGGPEQSVKYIKGIIEALKGNKKPLVFSVLGDTSPLAPEFLALARDNHIILSRSSERSLRAMAQATAHGRAVAAAKNSTPATPIPNLPKLGSGPQPEWLGKQVFAAAGIKIPDGALAKTADEAVATAKKIGFPVAMKAQAAKLAHKTEAGGVMLNIADEAGVRAAWQKLHDNIEKHQPGLKLDGVLVEKMSQKGLELVVGAKRDPQWGPVVLVGLGGIMVEALGDVRLLAGGSLGSGDRRGAAQAQGGKAARSVPRRACGRCGSGGEGRSHDRPADAHGAGDRGDRRQSADRAAEGAGRHRARCADRDEVGCIGYMRSSTAAAPCVLSMQVDPACSRLKQRGSAT